MIRYSFRWWHAVLLAVSAGALYLAFAYNANVKVFRYRLTMEIEADGRMHSASSVIEVKYLIGYDGLKNWNSRVRGVAPMIDLGPHGTIIAALDYQIDDIGRKERKAGWVPKSMWDTPVERADSLPLSAYELHPKNINSATGQIILKKYPCLVWVPPGGIWSAAQQLFPEELPTVVHPSIRLRQMTIEPAPWTAIITQIDPAPEWITALRIKQKDGVRRFPDLFTLSLSSQVERNGW